MAGNYDKTMTAEVRFLRALYYYHLMDCFGNIPFLTELSADNAPQASRKDVYNFIESELLAVREDMLEPAARKSGDEGYGRADRNAAALLHELAPGHQLHKLFLFFFLRRFFHMLLDAALDADDIIFL